MSKVKLLTVVILCFLSGTVWAPVMAWADYSSLYTPWMKNLDDDLLITQVTIPGTHDSAADHDHCDENSACKAVSWAVVTQTYNIQDQMEMGIRFFDVRLAYDQHNDRAFEFHHSSYDLKQSIGDAIGWAEDFLKKNPSEFLIWLIKQEHTKASADSFWYDLSNEFDGYPDLFYREKRIPTVGEVRGKIVIMARDKADYPQGYHVKWDSDTAYYVGVDKDLTYVAEDRYKLYGHSASSKFVDIRRNLYLARSCSDCNSSNSPNNLFITFLSGEGDPDHGPAHYAGYENLHTAKYLGEEAPKGPHSGIIAMDFAGDSAYDGDYILEVAIGQNPPHRIPHDYGDRNEGGGITTAHINDNDRPELIVLSIDSLEGENSAYYQIGWDIDKNGVPINSDNKSWTDRQAIPWQWKGQAGGGITVTDINSDGIPDLIVFMIHNPHGPNDGYYRIGYMDKTGTVGKWTDFMEIPGEFGDSTDGGGITTAHINDNDRPELIVLSIDDPSGENRGYYRIGWDIDVNGIPSYWTKRQSVPWQGKDQAGGGITATDMNNDKIPDLIVFMIDNPHGPNDGYYRIGYMDETGTVNKWTDFMGDSAWFGGANDGGGLTVDDIDGNGKPDLILFLIYDSDGENRGYYRILWDDWSGEGFPKNKE